MVCEVHEIRINFFTEERFFQVFRMSRDTFQKLCKSLKKCLVRQDTKWRMAIPLGKRVAICLFILKGGVNHASVADLFGVGHSTVGKLLSQFCDAMIKKHKELIKFPSTEKEKQTIAARYFEKFYDCFGSLDGTHIPILPPMEHAEDYHCFKGFHSINVLAMCDDNYCFT